MRCGCHWVPDRVACLPPSLPSQVHGAVWLLSAAQSAYYVGEGVCKKETGGCRGGPIHRCSNAQVSKQLVLYVSPHINPPGPGVRKAHPCQTAMPAS